MPKPELTQVCCMASAYPGRPGCGVAQPQAGTLQPRETPGGPDGQPSNGATTDAVSASRCASGESLLAQDRSTTTAVSAVRVSSQGIRRCNLWPQRTSNRWNSTMKVTRIHNTPAPVR